MRILVGGDLMLGRLVKEAMDERGSEYPLQPIFPLLQSADVTLVNLECAITNTTTLWSGDPKAFYFGAPLRAAEVLQKAGIDMVNLANNHLLDYDFQGLTDTLASLDKVGIVHTGAGENLEEAMRPAYFKGCGMVSFCDHQEDFAASSSRAGIAYLNLKDEKKALRAFEHSLEKIQHVDIPILSLHWGPNMVERPSKQFVRLAHAAVDMGYRLLFGHSTHIFQGVEIYKGCPILYAAGDLVDDYMVDPRLRNDHQLLLELQYEGSQFRSMRFHPLFISDCRVEPATGSRRTWIEERFKTLCAEMGTCAIS